ncbi:hypothetical protein BH23DEI1_BH23DEI1_10960 [soil metagenome]
MARRRRTTGETRVDAGAAPAPDGPVFHDGLTVIETSDEIELTMLLADRRIGGLIVARLGPTEAVVLPEHTEPLLKALQKAGHTPTVVDGP